MKLIVGGVGALVVLSLCNVGCSGGGSQKTGVVDGQPNSMGSASGGGQEAPAARRRPSATPAGARASVSDLFDQTIVPSYSIEISSDNWAKLDADFHDLKDVLAGTPPQTYYPIVFHYGSETVSNAGIRLRGKSSWVSTVMFDANPKMQFDVSFDQIDTKGKFHGVSTIHFTMPRDDWTFINDRIGNNWLREIGQTAPCANNAKLTINGDYYGLYISEGSVGTALLKQFFPGNYNGDLFKGGTEAETNTTIAELAAAAAAPRRHRHRDAAGPGRPAEHRARVGGRGGRQRRRRVLRRLAQLLHLRPGDARLALDSRPHRLGPGVARAVRPLGVVQGTSHLLVGRPHRAGRARRPTI